MAISTTTAENRLAKAAASVDLFAALLAPGERVSHLLRPGRHVLIQVAAGALTLDGQLLRAGDGASVSEEAQLDLIGTENAELLLFDLA